MQLIYRSSLVGPLASIKVIQFELPTFCAASWGKKTRKTIKLLLLRTTEGRSGGWGPHLPTGNVDGSDDVGCVGIVTSDAPGHGRAHQVLINVDLNHSFCSGLQHLEKRGVHTSHPPPEDPGVCYSCLSVPPENKVRPPYALSPVNFVSVNATDRQGARYDQQSSLMPTYTLILNFT